MAVGKSCHEAQSEGLELTPYGSVIDMLMLLTLDRKMMELRSLSNCGSNGHDQIQT